MLLPRRFCCLELRLGVQLMAAATLLVYVVAAVAAVTTLEKRRAAAGRAAEDTGSDVTKDKEDQPRFWLGDRTSRAVVGAMLVCGLDAAATALVLWATRTRTRWLLFPWLIYRALAAAALGLHLAAFVVGRFGGDGWGKAISRPAREAAPAVMAAATFAVVVYTWMAVLALFRRFGKGESRDTDSVIVVASADADSSASRLPRLIRVGDGRYGELPPTYDASAAAYDDENKPPPSYSSVVRRQLGSTSSEISIVSSNLDSNEVHPPGMLAPVEQVHQGNG